MEELKQQLLQAIIDNEIGKEGEPIYFNSCFQYMTDSTWTGIYLAQRGYVMLGEETLDDYYPYLLRSTWVKFPQQELTADML